MSGGVILEDVTARDDAWWDGLVVSRKGHFMQTSSWARLKEKRGWRALRAACFDGEELIGCAQVLTRRIAGVTIGYASRGPVAAENRDPSPFLERFRAFLRDKGVTFCRCDPYFENLALPSAKWLDVLDEEWSYWNAPRYVMFLKLDKDYDGYIKSFNAKARSKMLTPYKKGVEFFSETGEDHLDDFYALMSVTADKKGINVHDKEYYRDLVESFREPAKLRLFYASHEGAVISTGMSIVCGRIAWLLYAASDPEHYRLGASSGVQLEMLKWAMEEGCELYDFRGAATGNPPQESDPGYGVYAFKKKFGSEFTVLGNYFDVTNNGFARSSFRFVEKRILPVGVNMLSYFR